jgi:hypothetical protein
LPYRRVQRPIWPLDEFDAPALAEIAVPTQA